MDLFYGIHFGCSFFWYFCDLSFQLFKLLCLAYNHWWGFCTRNAHMVHIINEIRYKMEYTSWSLYFNHFTHLVSVTADGHESPWGHMQPSSTVDFSWLIRSVSRAATNFVLKFIEIVIFGVYSPSLLASICFGTFVISLFNFLATLFG